MDSIAVILIALGNAITAGTQSAVSDTVKETLEALLQRIRQSLTSRHSQQDSRKALLILDEYRQNPTIWEQPFKETLIKARLAQDAIAFTMAQHLLTLLDSQQNMRNTTYISHYGTGYGSVYGPNYGVINTAIFKEKTVDEGKTEMALGQDALWRGEYDAAQAHLEKARDVFLENQCPRESAKVRFLLALALLNGKRPRSVADQTFSRIKQLLEASIQLHTASSYLYTLALIKRDYAWNGYPRFSDEADMLIDQMKRHVSTQQDQDNINLVAHCQPRLTHDAQAWWP